MHGSTGPMPNGSEGAFPMRSSPKEDVPGAHGQGRTQGPVRGPAQEPARDRGEPAAAPAAGDALAAMARVEAPRSAGAARDFERLRACLRAHLAACRPLPASRQRPATANLKLVAQASGIGYFRLAGTGSAPFRKLIALAQTAAGAEPPRAEPDAPTLAIVRERVLQIVRLEAGARGERLREHLDPLKAAFGLVERREPEGENAMAAPAILATLAAAREGRLRGGERLLAALERIVGLLEAACGPPPAASLPEALAGALAARRMTQSDLARRLKARLADLGERPISQTTLSRWVTGLRDFVRPCGPDRRQARVLALIEEILGCGQGELVAHLASHRRGLGQLAEAAFPPRLRGDENASMRRAVAARLDLQAFIGLPQEERLAQIEAAAHEVEQMLRRRANYQELRDDVFALETLPEPLAGQFESLVAHHTARLPQGGLKRVRTWNGATPATRRSQIRLFCGFCARAGLLPKDGGIDLVDFLDPELQEAYFLWGLERRAAARGEETASPASADVITFACALLDPITGFVTQQPEVFGERVMELAARVIGGESVARFGHRERCRRLRERLKDFERAARNTTSRSRDDLRAVYPVLGLEKPLDVYGRILSCLPAPPADRPLTRTGAKILRKRILIGLLAQTGLRIETLSGLTYLPGGGDLIRRGRKWVVMVVRARLKNREYVNLDFNAELANSFGLYEDLARYLDEGRDLILDGARSEMVFVSTADNPAYSPPQLANLVRYTVRATIGLFGASEFRIPGLVDFGPHGFRQILATAVYRKEGRLDLAGAAIHVRPATAERHYVIRDKARLAADVQEVRSRLFADSETCAKPNKSVRTNECATRRERARPEESRKRAKPNAKSIAARCRK